MLYGLLVTLFIIICFILILLVLLQKSKSSMGLGNLGGGTQMLFGGSGGQDLFQKVTWGLGTAFMVTSLLLAMMKRPIRSDLLGRLATQSAGQTQVPEQQPAQAALPENNYGANA